MEKEKTLEDICFEFQQSLIDIFNNEKNIPFLLKYYLIEEIWNNIQNHKQTIDMEVRANHPPKSEVVKIVENQEESDKEDLTN